MAKFGFMVTMVGVTLCAAFRPCPVRTVLIIVVGPSLLSTTVRGLIIMVILFVRATLSVLVDARVK